MKHKFKVGDKLIIKHDAPDEIWKKEKSQVFTVVELCDFGDAWYRTDQGINIKEHYCLHYSKLHHALK
jgi:hypothetical protein